MKPSRALRIHAYGGSEVLKLDVIPVPIPAAGQVLVQVKAAGVNGLDWKIRAGFVRDAFPLALPAVLGIELAGVVAQTGPGVSRLKVGDRVMGPLSGVGAYADFVAVDEAKLSRTPDSLTDVAAAALPVATLTAWQAIRADGDIKPGQRVLIHGAAGGIGGFAVQFAKAAGATVFATASGASREHVLSLGADVVVNRSSERFEDRVRDVNLVLDLIGGETLDRSWQVLASDGVLVSTAAPDVAARAPAGHRGRWFMMQADAERLRAIADAVACGGVRSTIAEVTGFAGLAAAIDRNQRGHAPGKIVVDLSR
jgi:NADPH:quinone reductase-like Zn-dependent oxidoreductase